MIRRKRKNPILRNIGGIKYEIIDPPIYDEEKIIRKFSEILNKKFNSILGYTPLINFNKLKSNLDGQFNINDNLIIINSIVENTNNYLLRTLFHELGHFIYEKYLSDSAIKEFRNYIRRNTKFLDLEDLILLVEKKSEDIIRLKCPLKWAFIMSLYGNKEYTYYINEISQKDVDAPFSVDFLSWFYNRKQGKLKIFNKPPSWYIPNSEEIFCEIFANYMMYDLRLLHSDNYRILKELLPELRN